MRFPLTPYNMTEWLCKVIEIDSGVKIEVKKK